MRVVGGLICCMVVASPWMRTARAEENAVAFAAGAPVESTPDGHVQNGRLLIPETLETALSWEVAASQTEMQSALSKRTASYWCLGFAIPLLIGSVATLAVAESGTVGGIDGTMAVYGVSGGLAAGALGLSIAALVLSVQAGTHYQAAVDAYNASLGQPTTARLEFAPLPTGFAAQLTLRF